jgi:hypothetical protein
MNTSPCRSMNGRTWSAWGDVLTGPEADDGPLILLQLERSRTLGIEASIRGEVWLALEVHVATAFSPHLKPIDRSEPRGKQGAENNHAPPPIVPDGLSIIAHMSKLARLSQMQEAKTRVGIVKRRRLGQQHAHKVSHSLYEEELSKIAGATRPTISPPSKGATVSSPQRDSLWMTVQIRIASGLK